MANSVRAMVVADMPRVEAVRDGSLSFSIENGMRIVRERAQRPAGYVLIVPPGMRDDLAKMGVVMRSAPDVLFNDAQRIGEVWGEDEFRQRVLRYAVYETLPVDGPAGLVVPGRATCLAYGDVIVAWLSDGVVMSKGPFGNARQDTDLSKAGTVMYPIRVHLPVEFVRAMPTKQKVADILAQRILDLSGQSEDSKPFWEAVSTQRMMVHKLSLRGPGNCMVVPPGLREFLRIAGMTEVEGLANPFEDAVAIGVLPHPSGSSKIAVFESEALHAVRVVGEEVKPQEESPLVVGLIGLISDGVIHSYGPSGAIESEVRMALKGTFTYPQVLVWSRGVRVPECEGDVVTPS